MCIPCMLLVGRGDEAKRDEHSCNGVECGYLLYEHFAKLTRPRHLTRTATRCWSHVLPHCPRTRLVDWPWSFPLPVEGLIPRGSLRNESQGAPQQTLGKGVERQVGMDHLGQEILHEV